MDFETMFPGYSRIPGWLINETDEKHGRRTRVERVQHFTGQQRILKTFYGRNLSHLYTEIKKINNPHLVKVYDFVYDTETQNTYAIEESIDGTDLRTYIREHGALSPVDAIKIIQQICSGLNCLHGTKPPIIHNDIKPANIMIRGNGEAVLIDFDISRTLKKENVSKNTRALGSIGYTSPEHYSGIGQTTPASDIYSLGIVLHDMLTGTIQDFDSDLDDRETDCGKSLDARHNTYYNNIAYRGGLKKVIRKCLDPAPNRRYKSVKALSSALTPYLTPVKSLGGKIIIVVICTLITASIISLALKPSDETLSSQTAPALPLIETIAETASSTEQPETPVAITEYPEISTVAAEPLESSTTTAEQPETSAATESINTSNVSTESKIIELQATEPESETPNAVSAPIPLTSSTINTIARIDSQNYITFGLLPNNRYAYVTISDDTVAITSSDGRESVSSLSTKTLQLYGAALIFNETRNITYLLAPADADTLIIYELQEDLSLAKITELSSTGAFADGIKTLSHHLIDELFIYANGLIINISSWKIVEHYSSFYPLHNRHYAKTENGFNEYNSSGKYINSYNFSEDPLHLHASSYVTGHYIYSLGQDYLYRFDGTDFEIVLSLSELSSWNGVYCYSDLLITEDKICYYDHFDNCIREITY